MNALLNQLFTPYPEDMLNYRLHHKFDPYKSLTWEVQKRKLVINQNLNDQGREDMIPAAGGLQSKFAMTALFVPRATLHMEFDRSKDENVYGKIWLIEDLISGLQGTDFDPENLHVININ